jgi:hypothetical protein
MLRTVVQLLYTMWAGSCGAVCRFANQHMMMGKKGVMLTAFLRESLLVVRLRSTATAFH